MARLILLDQLRLTILIPGGLPDQQARQVSRLVNSARFRQELLRGIRAVFRQHPELAQTRVRLSG
jgi:hypothetical protein